MRGLKAYYKILAALTAVFLIFYPFLTRFHVAKPTGMELEYFAKKSKYIIDLFYYNKELCLFLFAIALLAAMAAGLVLYVLIQEKMPLGFFIEKDLLFLLGIYFLLNVLSCFFSEYREYGRLGLSLDYEGLAAIFAYMVLFGAGYLLFAAEKTEKFLYGAIQALSLLLFCGAVLETVCGSPFNWEWMQELLTPERYRHLMERFFLDYSGSVFLTFGNPGFFGGFCAMLFPIEFGFALLGKKLCAKVWNAFLAGGLFLCILLSGSSGALYGAILTLLLEGSFLFGKAGTKSFARTAGIWIAWLLALSFGIQFFSGTEENPLLHKLETSVLNPQYEKGEEIYTVEKIQLLEGRLHVEGEENAFIAEAKNAGQEPSYEEIALYGKEGEELPWRLTGEGGILEGAYEGISFTLLGDVLSFDFGYQDPVEFYIHEGSLYYIDFNGSLLEAIPQPQSTGLESFYPLFTGRGYIWISALPLLKEVIFTGKGIGAFPFVYQQSEVAGMLNVHGSADYCIEQAHSWYLQTAVSSGIVSLFCMLALFGSCFWRGLLRTAKTPKGRLGCQNLLFWGLLAYAITGIVNNSCIACAPLFWLLLGVSLRKTRK